MCNRVKNKQDAIVSSPERGGTPQSSDKIIQHANVISVDLIWNTSFEIVCLVVLSFVTKNCQYGVLGVSLWIVCHL